MGVFFTYSLLKFIYEAVDGALGYKYPLIAVYMAPSQAVCASLLERQRHVGELDFHPSITLGSWLRVIRVLSAFAFHLAQDRMTIYIKALRRNVWGPRLQLAKNLNTQHLVEE